MDSFTARREIDVPARRVWDIVADYARDPEWRSDVTEMRSDRAGLVTAGCRAHEVMKVGARTYRNDAVVERVVDGSFLAWRTTSGLEAEGSRAVRPLNGARCEVVLDLHVAPHGVDRLLAPILRPLIARGLRRDLGNLAELARSARTSTTG